jgi:hypothetical protein
MWLDLRAGRVGGGLATSLSTLAAIAVPAFLLGGFLPPLARSSGGGVAGLFAANLAGAVAGAWLVADRVVADHGRLVAAACAGVLAALAGVVGATAAGASLPSPQREPPIASPLLAWRTAAFVVAMTTAWLASLEWIGLRLGVLWLGGMQPALRAVLAASLISLAAGAALVPRLVPRGPAGVLAALAACSVGSLWPFVAGSTIARLGSEGGELRTALLLVGPALLPFGGIVPVLHRALPLESGERLGRLLVHEAWGAVLGLPLVQLALVPRIGLGGSLAGLQIFGLAAAVALVRAPAERRPRRVHARLRSPRARSRRRGASRRSRTRSGRDRGGPRLHRQS